LRLADGSSRLADADELDFETTLALLELLGQSVLSGLLGLLGKL
jgi:hypothetical protein